MHALAQSQGAKAIGVVLSGSAADGTLGLQEIKAAGGITFAQDDTAKYTSMPRTAIATGAVDFVLAPADIARELGRIASHPLVGAEPDEPAVALPDMEPVFEILHEAAGVDFRHYKPNTLYRRIARRVVLHKLDGLPDYVRMLRGSAAEAQALYQDILINVTSFFRNPEAFEALKDHVFPTLTENRSRHDPLRVWTLGCSTGEEAYSIAMAFSEYAEKVERPLTLQLFATDLNESGVEKARIGIYSRNAVQDVSAERLRRFFVEMDGGTYRIAKPIRDACVFARHNVLTDPPFSRIDLVSCRNMLIYLGAEIQQKVIPILHYALRGSGVLWLGTSETIGSYRDLFEVKDTKYKIYMKNAGLVRPGIDATAEPRTTSVKPARPVYTPEIAMPQHDSLKDAERILVARYAPPSILIRSDLEILQYRGNTSTYLAPAPGRASLNLLKMLREGLVLGVRAAVEAARIDEKPVRKEGLRFVLNGAEREVNVEVIPVKSGIQRAELFMVVFEDASKPAEAPEEKRPKPTKDAATQEIERMRQELAATREYLQSVIEQQEAANEELQSANEEVQSSNEELQSINEELETSKEEVQSSNEELATVNDELHARNTELAQSNNDLVNLFSSVQLAIVMLGPNMRIRRITPPAEKLLNLIPADVGRPVSDIKLSIDVPDMEALISEVMDTMSPREREVQDRDGRWYLLRIRPYRTLENKIDGAVIVLVDVDSLKRSQEMLRQQTELLNQAHEPIMMWELDGDIGYWNKAAEEIYGFTRDQALGRKLEELLMISPRVETFASQLRAQGHWTGELVHTRRDGQKIIVESRMVVVGDAAGSKIVVEATRPITERKESERILRRLADDLVTADRNKDEFLAMLAHELRNPLAPLRNVVSVLQSESVGSDDKSKALEIMDRQISSMARLLDDLLDVSRITLSQIGLRKERIELVGALRRVVEQNASYFKLRQQSLHLSLPREPLYVHADPVRLEQIVGNLLNNASKYTQRGGEIFLTLDGAALDGSAAPAEGAPRSAVIRVKDNGAGIAADKLPFVFDMFMRATRSIDQEYGGLGVGLTLVRRLTELHGGTVEARSGGPGKGSEFSVRLPAADDGASRAAATGSSVTAVRTRETPHPCCGRQSG
jgi:two-component system CheB/CheR fusion protein